MTENFKLIKAGAVKEMLSQNPGLQIVDVREPVEYAAEKIEGVLNILLSSFKTASQTIPSGKPVYLLCRTGGRASQAAEKLCGMGNKEVYVIEGGLEECKRSGILIKTGASHVWALDRQVRFAAGALVLLGIILSWLLQPAFIGLSLFVGAGLVFSGITNTCGMAMMLAKMPWNQVSPSSCLPKNN